MSFRDMQERNIVKRKIMRLSFWKCYILFCIVIITYFCMYIVFKSDEDTNIKIFFSRQNRRNFDIYKLDQLSIVSLQLPVVRKINSKLEDNSWCDVKDEHKFDCHPDFPSTKRECLNRGCCWKAKQKLREKHGSYPNGVPSCFYPTNYTGYKVKDVRIHKRGISGQLQRVRPSGFIKDIKNVNVSVYYHNNKSVRIRLTDTDNTRYEVNLLQPSLHVPNLDSDIKFRLEYTVNFYKNGTLFIRRNFDRQIIFYTNLARLIYSDQLLQLSSQLPTRFIYGLGQHKAPLLRDVNWKRFTLFNRDRRPMEDHSTYGTHPFYLALEKKGNSHGVVLINSNAMDIILQPAPAITYRPIGGILDFYIFLGPKPSDVIQQYTRIIGTTFMPPYWSLGFHLCKYNYTTLNHTIEVWNRTRAAKIPFDTQWSDIDYMHKYNDFTYDIIRYKRLPEFVKELHRIGMHWVPIVDPGISNAERSGTYPPYDDGIKMDVFIKDITGQIFTGKVWNEINTVYPDFTHPNVSKYWTKQFEKFYSMVEYDGAWIDMNEPANFLDGQGYGCPNTSYDFPQYVPGGVEPLHTHTLCMSCKQYGSIHYNVHSLYAFRESLITHEILRNIRKKRPFMISRASFAGLGHYSGNWNGDILSTWDDMKWSIPSILNFNMFGISMVGADICGFEGNTTVDLCTRWSALGAFYPFSRNHNSNDTIEQDPVILGPRVVAAAKRSLNIRYFLLPYLYTLFYKCHVYGETVARPLFFEYPTDSNTYDIDEQFLWGKSLMIIPILYPNVYKANAYFPNDTWYDYFTGRRYDHTGIYITIDVFNDTVALAIRGGSIIPAQNASITTTKSRLNGFYLIVALNGSKMAEGELFWDDGDSLDTIQRKKYNIIAFTAFKNYVRTLPLITGYGNMPNFENMKILGCESKPKYVFANEEEAEFIYNKANKVLTIYHIRLSFLSENIIKWVAVDQ